MASQLLPAGKGWDISGVGRSFPWAGLGGGAGFPWGFGQLQHSSTCAGSHRFPGLLVALGTQQDLPGGILWRCHHFPKLPWEEQGVKCGTLTSGGLSSPWCHPHPPARSCSQWNNPQLQSRSDGHEPNHGNFHLNPWRVQSPGAAAQAVCGVSLFGDTPMPPGCVPVSPAPGVPTPELPSQPSHALALSIRVAHVALEMWLIGQGVPTGPAWPHCCPCARGVEIPGGDRGSICSLGF